eukprot:CAMPEP_0172374286 /NCGR_PEP_ID=MMETSP1060-20121228/55200_1 /TAXON_ID=37318 /ORGANISM="Pseudo-nitzschia pungens, Strain cf. cingulata" /LENGTH=64 /DNA_ID=CAMNT_0013100887 /DNA_START=169 /DNA_END=360 /DNA_ORIENTATION=+
MTETKTQSWSTDDTSEQTVACDAADSILRSGKQDRGCNVVPMEQMDCCWLGIVVVTAVVVVTVV